jgi:hypothetical protein
MWMFGKWVLRYDFSVVKGVDGNGKQGFKILSLELAKRLVAYQTATTLQVCFWGFSTRIHMLIASIRLLKIICKLL